jgi:hypothetical protein
MRRRTEADLRREHDEHIGWVETRTTALPAIKRDFREVSGHAETLRRRVLDPKAKPALEAIATAAGHGERVTQQLLNLFGEPTD